MQTDRHGTPKVPILIGGGGPKRTPALAARFADEFNLPFKPLADVVTQFARVRAACEAVDRDPAELTYSVAHTVCVGENDAELARRAAATGRELDDLRENGIAGTPAQVLEQLGELAAAGVQRVYLQVLDLADLEHVALLGRDVRPAVADA